MQVFLIISIINICLNLILSIVLFLIKRIQDVNEKRIDEIEKSIDKIEQSLQNARETISNLCGKIQVYMQSLKVENVIKE